MTPLLREARRRAVRLARDESGVALMLTLSVFLLLYVLCAGLYAVAETVRQKVELQNACDAAAYSAAVVQADGLSRMAVVNRAMSWTYVQLTNLQMDYITARWLRLAAARFHADERNCRDFNGKSHFWGYCKKDCKHKYSGAGIGWFCGSGLVHGSLRLNGEKTVPVSTLDKVPSLDAYREHICNLKDAIMSYNFLQKMLCSSMYRAINDTARIALLANLPRLTTDDAAQIDTRFSAGDPRTGIDRTVARDMLGYVDVRQPGDPYAAEADDQTVDGTVLGGGYFSPLHNTEAGERLFLTMADGAAYDTLEEYFGERGKNGGLDQWFIRSDADESAANTTRLPSATASEETFRRRYRAPGICRVYKNANRPEGGDILRGHHTTSLVTGFFSDDAPSCRNARRYFPEQCAKVKETVALYADWEWAAVQVSTFCYINWRGRGRHPVHVATGGSFPFGVQPTCPHLCCRTAKASHARHPAGDGPFTKSCYENQWSRVALSGLAWVNHKYLPLFGPWYFGNYLRMNPNGFGRVYGDDDEIYDRATYTGTPAQPWILNESFYGRDGAIVVGLARRQRNPFAVLMNALTGEDRTDADGLYAAFNPVTNGYLVAFAAARAAHHFHPSAQQVAVAPDLEDEWNGDDRLRDYETRYDAVCHDSLSPDLTKFNLNPGNAALKAFHIGCVCGDHDNRQRFARNWNLCETDWDATLLPLAYARADTGSEWFDSYRAVQGAMGNAAWEHPDVLSRQYANPFQAAYGLARDDDRADEVRAENLWLPFYDAAGNLVQEGAEDAAGYARADFLQMARPAGMSRATDATGRFDLYGGMRLRVL